jgi:hypothetical protein
LQQCKAAQPTISARLRYLGARGDLQGDRFMVRMNLYLAGVLVGLAVSALATPSFAQRSEGGDVGISSGRAKALRDCNAQAGKMSQHTWGDHQIQNYRSCMMQHGQQEE